MADCVIESDMELLLPADYVPTESERIALYQELDGIERELDLQAFKTVSPTVSAPSRQSPPNCCAFRVCGASLAVLA